MVELLDRGREAFGRRAWADAYAALALADDSVSLARDDLERLGISAYLTGRDPEFAKSFERAFHAHVDAGDRMRGARCAFWLCLHFLIRGETGPASGWLSRGRRLVDSVECAEEGYLLLPTVEQSLAERNGEAAHSAASRATAIGERFRDADLIACGRHLEGRALIQQAQITPGLSLLDEAMLSVIAGELSPMMTGLVYCSVIEVCHEVGALRRAREWTIAFSTWCQQQPDLVAFTGTCLVRRAEILQLNGAWPDAMSEARRACERFEQANRKPPGAAFYQQAEIFRLRGDVAAAEDAYERANRMGFDPQPGLALLRLAQGRTDLACAAIRRVLKSGADSFQRARVLPAYVDIMVASGAIEDARVACDQLEQLADNIGTEALRAMASQARGAVELASNDPGAALQLLRRAFEAWAQIDAPYALARCRILVGMACRSLGDEEAAGLELRAARTTFERLGALPDLARLDSIQRPPGATRSQPLTGRELQVLRLVAAGKTNKAIAAQLALSERTIDRHVSNILTKLDASSRAAAIAHAYDHKLF